MNNGLYKEDDCFPKSIFSHMYDNREKKNYKNVLSQLVQYKYTQRFIVYRHLIYYMPVFYTLQNCVWYSSILKNSYNIIL